MVSARSIVIGCPAASDFAVSCNGQTVPHLLTSDASTATLTASLPPFRLAGPSTQIGLTVRECVTPTPDRPSTTWSELSKSQPDVTESWEAMQRYREETGIHIH